MVSTKTLTLLALSATAAVALPHRRNGNVCAGPKTETVTSLKYVQTTTAAAAVAAPSSIITTTTTTTVITTTTTTQAAGNFYEATPQPVTTLATSVIPSSAVAPVAAPTDTPVPSSRSDETAAPTVSKKGLAYNDASLLSLFSGSGAGWAYNWGSAPGGEIPTGVEFVPMCWGRNEAPTCAEKILAQSPTHMLSFNEPDQVGQAHMDVAEAVNLHINNVAQPLAGKVKIGSPAVTNGQKELGMGLGYLKSFLEGCAGRCELDFLNIHWYWEASGEEDFETRFADHVEEAVELAKQYTTSRQVWITEFSNKGTPEQNVQFMHRAVDYLEKNPDVARYSYFMVGAADGMGMVDGKSLNTLGQAYNA